MVAGSAVYLVRHVARLANGVEQEHARAAVGLVD